MKHNITYYFSQEFYEKNKQEKLNTIKELITKYDNEFNSYESISFTIKQFDEKTKKLAINIKTFIVIYIITFAMIFTYILLKNLELNINPFYFFSISLIIATLFIFYIIKSLKKEKKTNIETIELNKDDLKFIFEDKQEKTFNIKEINLTTKITNTKDNYNSTDYIISIQNKNTLIKEKFYINTSQVENEFLATIIFINCILSSINIKEINNDQLLNLYENTFKENTKSVQKNNQKIFLTLGIICSILSLILFINIIYNCITIIKYDKINANITKFGNVNYLNNNGDRIQYNYIEISYEYNDETYFKTIRTDYTIIDRIHKKKTIYVDKMSPQTFTYFHLSNLISFIVLSFISYFIINKYKTLNTKML